jgi:hypothetical protein
VVKAVKAEAVKVDKAVEIVIEAGANIKVEDAVVKVKKEVTIALIIGYYY